MKEVLGNPIVRLPFVILFIFILLPFLLSYTTIRSTLASYNICFVGPTSTGVKTNQLNQVIGTKSKQSSASTHSEAHQHEHPAKTKEELLYGTYQSYQHTNYYFIQRLYPLEDYLFGCTNLWFFGSSSNINKNKKCGWPNGLIISQTLNKQTWNTVKKEWVLRSQLLHKGLSVPHNVRNTSTHQQLLQVGVAEHKSKHAIYWDQGHTPFVSGQSRWCLGVAEQSATTAPQERAGKPSESAKYCTPEVPSILSDSSHAPYFPELPLNPPPSGSLVWGNPNLSVQCYSSSSNHDQKKSAMSPSTGVSDMLGDTTLSKSSSSEEEDDGSLIVFSWDITSLPSMWILALFLIYQYHYLHQRRERATTIYSRIKSAQSNAILPHPSTTLTNPSSSSQSPWLFPDICTILVLPYRHISLPLLVWNVYNVYIISLTLERRYTSILFLNLFFSISLLNTITSILLGQCYYYYCNPCCYTKPNTNASTTNTVHHYQWLPCGLSSTISTFLVFVVLQYDLYHLLPNVYITSRHVFFLAFPVMNWLVQYLLVPNSYYFRYSNTSANPNTTSTRTHPLPWRNVYHDSNEAGNGTVTLTNYELLSTLFISSKTIPPTVSSTARNHNSNTTATNTNTHEKHYNTIVGHISGTIWGYILHTNLIPIQILMPYILIPILILIGYFYQSHVLQQQQIIKKQQQQKRLHTPSKSDYKQTEDGGYGNDINEDGIQLGATSSNGSSYHKAYIHERESLLQRDADFVRNDSIHDNDTFSVDSGLTSNNSTTSSSMTPITTHTSNTNSNTIISNSSNSSKISYNTITLLKKIHQQLYNYIKIYFYILFTCQFIFLGFGFVILYDHYKSISLFIHLYLLYYCFYQFTIHVMYPNYHFYQEDYDFILEQEEKLLQQQFKEDEVQRRWSLSMKKKQALHNNATASLKHRKHYYYSLQLVHYIFQGYTFVLILEFINDGMTLGTWMATKSLIMSYYSRTYLVQMRDVFGFWCIKILLNLGCLFGILAMKWILFCVCNEGQLLNYGSGGRKTHKNARGGVDNASDGKKDSSSSSSEDSLLLLEHGIGSWIFPKIVVLFFEE